MTQIQKTRNDNFRELEMKILKWAEEREILTKANPTTQALKTLEEVTELLHNAVKNDPEGMKDDFGDVLVTIIIGSHLAGLDLLECLEHAFNEIKDRKGKMINGTFVKN